ncbi:MAG: hypothetical protein H7246_19825 [Phycisphaerae bacterium]|nr:hypothetical protein [Saprospiraceae bacterium]
MLFTRQHSSVGKQASDARSLPILAFVTASVKNWRPISICLSAVGSRSRQYGMPGFVDKGDCGGSKPCDRMSAQTHVSMKNARKETGLPVSDKIRALGPLNADSPSDPAIFEHQIFSDKPAPRQPESPDVESLRSLLKANLSREKASPALIQRIRSRMHENKE